MEKYKIILNEIVPLTFILTGILNKIVRGREIHRIIFLVAIKDHKVVKIYGNPKISLDCCEGIELTVYEPRVKDKDVIKDLERIKTVCSDTSFEDWSETLELIFKTRAVTNEVYMKYLRYTVELEKLILQNLSDSKEAHDLRDLMDPLWNNLTQYERYLINCGRNHKSEKLSGKYIEPKVIIKHTN